MMVPAIQLPSPRLKELLPATAIAFRGYNQTNLGRTGELLAHSEYGPIVERHLRLAQLVYHDVMHRRADLLGRVRAGRESTLDTFAEDIALIIAVELAQIELLHQFFDIDYTKARLGVGYSLGEVTALVSSGTFVVEQVLPPLLNLADECAELARDTAMGIVFSRGPALDMDAVQRICLEITLEGRGVLAISSFLSPNTVLVLGQGDTLNRLRGRIKDDLHSQVHLRRHEGHWPPLHTPLLRQKHIPDRAALLMQQIPGGLQTPSPPVLSLVTGKASYNQYNSRELLRRWLDEPQRLWDVVCELLSSGTELVIHVGPEPNLLPATFKRLSDNVQAQLQGRTFNSLSMRAMSGIASRPWLSKVLTARVALLRAPYVLHVTLEDWLLAQKPEEDRHTRPLLAG